MIFLVLSCLEMDIDSRACQVTDSWTVVETARVQSREWYPAPKLHALHSSDKVLTRDSRLFLKFLRNYSIIKVNNSNDIMWISLTLPCTPPNMMWQRKVLHLWDTHTHTHTHTHTPQNPKTRSQSNRKSSQVAQWCRTRPPSRRCRFDLLVWRSPGKQPHYFCLGNPIERVNS